MPTYDYRCPECGIVERFHAMGAAPPTEGCPTCGTVAARVFSAPSLRRTPGHLVSALERAEKSRDEPEVVRREPKKGVLECQT